MRIKFYLLLYMNVKHDLSSKVRVFKNRVMRGIFGPKTEEVTGEWRENYTMGNFISCSLH
jgi:hypothetical protein